MLGCREVPNALCPKLCVRDDIICHREGAHWVCFPTPLPAAASLPRAFLLASPSRPPLLIHLRVTLHASRLNLWGKKWSHLQTVIHQELQEFSSAKKKKKENCSVVSAHTSSKAAPSLLNFYWNAFPLKLSSYFN